MRTHKVTGLSYTTSTKLNFEHPEYNIIIVLLKTNNNIVNIKNVCFKTLFRNTRENYIHSLFCLYKVDQNPTRIGITVIIFSIIVSLNVI